ncbi:MAG: ChaN family lipoprotein [Gemmatimonadota bacterium]
MICGSRQPHTSRSRLLPLLLLAPPSLAAQTPAYTPHRVYDTHAKKFIDFEMMTAKLAAADVVFVGEEHDDPPTHRMEHALLEGIARRRDAVLALEMFERDTQGALDAYLAGTTDEADFLAGARPWPRYVTDYRALVELAKERKWPVVAADVPRRFASMVARGGLAALDSLADTSRTQVAREIDCPDDDYAKRFRKEMDGMQGHGGAPASPEDTKARIERMYTAQCVKDETMAESVARVWEPGRLIVHFNGSFHSDFGLGAAARVKRRLPNARVVVVSMVPTPDLDQLDPRGDDRKRADYLLYVLKLATASPAPH